MAKDILYCDNPQCKEAIRGSEIVYDEEHKEIYHFNGRCADYAGAWRVLKANTPKIQHTTNIPREKALELLKEGKLKQSKKSKLESSLQSTTKH